MEQIALRMLGWVATTGYTPVKPVIATRTANIKIN